MRRIKVSRSILVPALLCACTLFSVPAIAEDGTEEVSDEAETLEAQGFGRYQTILDRMPFGEVPPNFDPTLPPAAQAAQAAAGGAAQGEMTAEQRTEEEQKLASSVRVSVLNLSPSGRTMVGFTDSTAQPPENYYLPVGGERNGWKVESADPAEEKVTLAKDGISVTLKLGEGSTGGKAGAGGKNVPGNRPTGGNRPFLRGAAPRPLLTSPRLPGSAPSPQAATPATARGGAMARLQERRRQRMQEKAEADKRKAEAAAEAAAEREREKEKREAEKAEAEAEREQQREQLKQIQEELRRAREERQKKSEAEQDAAAQESE